METLLTPKKSIDVLRAALAAKNAGRVYTIVFLGVNGVGKSTNLAKAMKKSMENATENPSESIGSQ